ncbi:MAG: copper oxidase [Nitrospiraceae bacterium]|nr:MAG: copper oxidase [Nitrospiraceae bacterium]
MRGRLVPSAWLFVALLFLTAAPGWAATIEYNLTIEKTTISVTGYPSQAMTINGTIPGPTLRFQEGDIARIHVHNKMDADSSIHWHGILVPPGMDGVPFISFPPIAPGTTFTYEFPIRQSGTYWYHSHTMLQEQIGVYGAIVIEPQGESRHADRDYVVLLSDWTDEDPEEVMRTLKRGSEWYAIKKRNGQSILGAARLGMLGNYLKLELQRMPPMDISDIAYDRFLVNGSPEITLPAEPGEIVRLRIIDGSATTYFNLEYAGGPMKIISADGQDVEPVDERRFLIAVAETYDVLIRVPASGAYEFRATAHDGSGHASAWIGSGDRRPAPDVPKPNLYHVMSHINLKSILAFTPAGAMGMPDNAVEAGDFDEPGMLMMPGMHNMPDMQNMDHDSMKPEEMDHEGHGTSMDHDTTPHAGPVSGAGLLSEDISSHPDLAMDGMDLRRPWPPYDRLRSTRPTAFAEDRQAREIRLTLDGDMERYVWFMNNKPLSETDSIPIRKGEVVRFILINRTMMHHPMHLHGHFFRVLNNHEDYAPLKHTVNVAPMSTTVIEFDANEFGDWFFHCHLLYHMESGMARLVHYEGYSPDITVSSIRHKLYHDPWYFLGKADVLSNMTEGFLKLSNTRNIVTGQWEAGWQKVDELDWEGILTWDRYINGFFSVFAGADFQGTGDAVDDVRGVLGLRYLLPLNLEMRAWLDTDGGGRVSFEKSFHLTPRLGLYGEAEYDTHDQWEGKTGLSYIVTKNISLLLQWHSEFGWGGGLKVWF